jgi:saccharopine dehydrogenase-like NADP-dependent oxidoreductase
VLDEFSPGSSRFYWQDGRLAETPAFSGAKRVKFAEPVGEIETYYVPHSETHTLSRSLGKGVRQIDVRGTWRPNIMQALRLFADLKLTADQSINFNGQRIGSKSFLREHILQTAADFGAEGEWAFLLNVEVLGRRDGQPHQIVSNTSHPPNAEWGHDATARMTGIPASIGAQKLARGEAVRTGVMAPDDCFEPEGFLAELARRGIQVSSS